MKKKYDMIESTTSSILKKIENARKEYAEGKCTECRNHEELNAFFESL